MLSHPSSSGLQVLTFAGPRRTQLCPMSWTVTRFEYCIRFVLANELCNISLAILRCQLGCTSTGLVEHFDISTTPKQQLEMPMSRRGMQYSPAVAVRSMHSRSASKEDET